MALSSDATLSVHDVTKVFDFGDVQVHALRGVTLSVQPGEFVAIMGSSGSGKSTLMNILGCLDQPTSGEYLLDGVPIAPLNRNRLADLRNEKIGFVFQGFNLLPRTTALENVELPLLYDRRRRISDPEASAIEALTRVGLGDRLHHHPNQLSGGQQQRVAIARALVNRPAIVLADEPTGNLDSHTTLEVLSLFQQLNREGLTLVLVTHETEVARYASRLVELRDGRVCRDETIAAPRDAATDLAALPVENEI
jgi:putative ABC transport system ATP-binding protein